jgi:hypothetical protein
LPPPASGTYAVDSRRPVDHQPARALCLSEARLNGSAARPRSSIYAPMRGGAKSWAFLARRRGSSMMSLGMLEALDSAALMPIQRWIHRRSGESVDSP